MQKCWIYFYQNSETIHFEMRPNSPHILFFCGQVVNQTSLNTGARRHRLIWVCMMTIRHTNPLLRHLYHFISLSEQRLYWILLLRGNHIGEKALVASRRSHVHWIAHQYHSSFEVSLQQQSYCASQILNSRSTFFTTINISEALKSRAVMAKTGELCFRSIQSIWTVRC